jgi:hypothetical protein
LVTPEWRIETGHSPRSHQAIADTLAIDFLFIKRLALLYANRQKKQGPDIKRSFEENYITLTKGFVLFGFCSCLWQRQRRFSLNEFSEQV